MGKNKVIKNAAVYISAIIYYYLVIFVFVDNADYNFGIGIAVCIIVILSSKIKVFNSILSILSIPIAIITLIVLVLIPTLYIPTILISSFGVVYFTVNLLFSFTYNYVSQNTINYITLSLSFILLTYISKINFEKITNGNKQIAEILNHVYNKEQIKIFIFSMYFVLIILATILKNECLRIEYIDEYSVIQSFATYIAFDRVIKSINIGFTEFVAKFKGLYTKYIKDVMRKE